MKDCVKEGKSKCHQAACEESRVAAEDRMHGQVENVQKLHGS